MYAQSTCNNFRSRSNYIKYFFNKKIFISFPILSIDIYIIRCFQFLEKKNIWLTGLDPSTWNFYLSFGLFRISAILQGVYKRSLRNQVIKGIVHLVKNRFKKTQFLEWRPPAAPIQRWQCMICPWKRFFSILVSLLNGKEKHYQN